MIFLSFGSSFLFFVRECFFIENKQQNHTNADGRIGNIEYRIKKGEIFPAPKWQPFWKRAFPKRKIEHIYHFSVKNCSVATGLWEQLGHLPMAVVENISIENSNCDLRNFSGNAHLKTVKGNITVVANNDVSGKAFSKYGIVKNELTSNKKFLVEAESIHGSISLLQTK